jgi:hypothetical protein
VGQMALVLTPGIGVDARLPFPIPGPATR